MQEKTESFDDLALLFKPTLFSDEKYVVENALFRPTDCISKNFTKLAIIIPFRDDQKSRFFKFYELIVFCYNFLSKLKKSLKDTSSKRPVKMAIILSYSPSSKVLHMILV